MMSSDLDRLSALFLLPGDLATRPVDYQLGFLAGTREQWLTVWRQMVWLGPMQQAIDAGEVVGMLERAMTAVQRREP